MFDFDWTEYERLIGEFIRTYKEGEAVGVAWKLKTLTEPSTYLLQKRQEHKLIRDRVCHGGHILWANGESLLAKGRSRPSHEDWYPCSMPINFLAQTFLGLGYNDPVRLLNNKWDRGPGRVSPGGVTMESLKNGIAWMRFFALACDCATRVEIRKKKKGHFLVRAHWKPDAETRLPIVHVEQGSWRPRYDENAQEPAEWGEVDQAVGAFLRAWSEILVGLRQLEIMMANPSGPGSQMDLSSAATDMKRTEKVLGSGHPVARGLMDMSKERALIVHGDRMMGGIVDRSLRAERGVWLRPVQTIKDYIEPICLAVKEVNTIVDERRSEWGT